MKIKVITLLRILGPLEMIDGDFTTFGNNELKLTQFNHILEV